MMKFLNAAEFDDARDFWRLESRPGRPASKEGKGENEGGPLCKKDALKQPDGGC